MEKKNLVLLLVGQFAAKTATGLLVIAATLETIKVTGGNAYVGIAVTAASLPIALLCIIAGLCAVRFPERNTLLVAQLVNVCVASYMFYFSATDRSSLGSILVGLSVFGVVGALDRPLQKTFLMKMVSESTMHPVVVNSALLTTVGVAIGSVLFIIPVSILQEGIVILYMCSLVGFMLHTFSLWLLPAVEGSNSSKSLELLRNTVTEVVSTRVTLMLLFLIIVTFTFICSMKETLVLLNSSNTANSLSGLILAYTLGSAYGSLLLIRSRFNNTEEAFSLGAYLVSLAGGVLLLQAIALINVQYATRSLWAKCL